MVERTRGGMTPVEGLVGTLGLLGLAAFPLWWSVGEAHQGNRMFLLALGTMLVALATWRGVVTVRGLMAVRASVRP